MVIHQFPVASCWELQGSKDGTRLQILRFTFQQSLMRFSAVLIAVLAVSNSLTVDE